MNKPLRKRDRSTETRVQTLLPKETFLIVQEISSLSGLPMSSIVSQIVAASHDGFVAIRDAFVVAQNSKEAQQAINDLAAKAEEISADIQKHKR